MSRHKHDFDRDIDALKHICRDLDDIAKDITEMATLLRQLNSRVFYLLLVLIIAVCTLAGVRLVLPTA